MANTSSAKKATRQTIRRTAVNKARRTKMRSAVRSLEEALAAGDRAQAETAFLEAQTALMRSAQQGIVHANTASRKVSRMAQRLKAMA